MTASAFIFKAATFKISEVQTQVPTVWMKVQNIINKMEDGEAKTDFTSS